MRTGTGDSCKDQRALRRKEGRGLRGGAADGLLLPVLVLLQVAAHGHRGLVLVYLGGSFLFRERDDFVLQKSSLLFKLYSLLLVNSFEVLEFGLQLGNKGAVSPTTERQPCRSVTSSDRAAS